MINNSYSSEKYNNTHASGNERRREEKIRKVLELSEVRETQAIDLQLANRLKVKLHILMNVDDEWNSNQRKGKTCIPINQIV